MESQNLARTWNTLKEKTRGCVLVVNVVPSVVVEASAALELEGPAEEDVDVVSTMNVSVSSVVDVSVFWVEEDIDVGVEARPVVLVVSSSPPSPPSSPSPSPSPWLSIAAVHGLALFINSGVHGSAGQQPLKLPQV